MLLHSKKIIVKLLIEAAKPHANKCTLFFETKILINFEFLNFDFFLISKESVSVGIKFCELRLVFRALFYCLKFYLLAF